MNTQAADALWVLTASLTCSGNSYLLSSCWGDRAGSASCETNLRFRIISVSPSSEIHILIKTLQMSSANFRLITLWFVLFSLLRGL